MPYGALYGAIMELYERDWSYKGLPSVRIFPDKFSVLYFCPSKTYCSLRRLMKLSSLHRTISRKSNQKPHDDRSNIKWFMYFSWKWISEILTQKSSRISYWFVIVLNGIVVPRNPLPQKPNSSSFKIHLNMK